jgi:single-stranded-DNA-specific exonuclease
MTKWVDASPVTPSEEILSNIGGHPIVAQTLIRRGITNLQSAKGFLNPDDYQPSPPGEMPGVQLAIPIIFDAIRQEKPILVWGDFDVDGQTATTLLVSGLRLLGAQVTHYIPERATESHGIHQERLQSLLKDKPGLMITCDTGISAHEAVNLAKSESVMVVITDHHQLPITLPPADAIVTPGLLSPDHPLFTLPGVGVAYKLMEGLFNDRKKENELFSFLDLVALGIVADVAELTGDTRYLLQLGMKALQNTQRLGLQLLIEQAEMKSETLTSEHIAFGLAPRLNALGRLANANLVVDFLTTNDRTQARLTAMELERLNAKRKLLTDQVFEGALSQITRQPDLSDLPVLVMSHPQWPSGVIGIVASRLVEHFHKPVVLISSPPGELARGSARSVPGIDITQAIASQIHLLQGFGGHPMAGGLGIQSEKIEEFRQGLAQNIANQQQSKANSLQAQIVISEWVKLSDITLEFVKDINRLAPFGPGNPPLIFGANHLRVASKRQVGRYKEHLIIRVLDDSDVSFDVIWWQGAGFELPDDPFDLAFTVQSSNFQGKEGVQLTWLEARTCEDKQSLSKPSTKIVSFDHRNEKEPIMILTDLAPQTGVVIWCEGEECKLPRQYDRYHLPRADTLIIWNIPPSQSVLKSTIRKVDPHTVLFFAINPNFDTPRTFINRLGGLAKFLLNRKDGNGKISRLACLTAQTISNVKLGLRWLETQGMISITFKDEDEFSIQAGTKWNEEARIETERLLTLSLDEVAAYRSYYVRADIDRLLD